MPLAVWTISLAVLAWAFFTRWVLDNPRGDPVAGLIFRGNELYVRWFHSLRVRGRGNVPRDGGPLVVVCNHTAGIDPMLVQGVLPLEVRWVMGLDMMVPTFRWFWEWAGVIGVDRTGRDLAGTRASLRHLKAGGVLGVFPEGGIERPPHRLRDFHDGVGFLVARSHAPVLPIFIDGTPQVDPAWASLTRMSRSRLRIGEVMRFGGESPAEITAAIRGWFVRESGWVE